MPFFFSTYWFYVVLLSSILMALANLLQKIALKNERVDSISFSIYFQLLVGVFCIPLASIESINVTWNKTLIATLFIVCFIYAIANVLYYKSLKNIELSHVRIIKSSSLIWIMFGAYLFLHEEITLFKIIGTLLIISGISLIFWKKGKFSEFGHFHILIVLNAILAAAAAILDKYNLIYFESPAFYMIITFIVPAIMTAIFFPKAFIKIRKIASLNKQNLYIIISALLNNIACFLFFKVLQAGGKVSLANPVWQSSIIFSIILGILFLNERGNWIKKIIGSIIVFIGIIMLKMSF